MQNLANLLELQVLMAHVLVNYIPRLKTLEINLYNFSYHEKLLVKKDFLKMKIIQLTPIHHNSELKIGLTETVLEGKNTNSKNILFILEVPSLII